jgi:hypothetical protein
MAGECTSEGGNDENDEEMVVRAQEKDGNPSDASSPRSVASSPASDVGMTHFTNMPRQQSSSSLHNFFPLPLNFYNILLVFLSMIE